MANTLRFKRGLASGLPTGLAGEPLFTTDTFDLYIGNGTTNTRFQKYIASGTTAQYLRGDGTLATFPSLTGFVPYTGATANVDLGVYTILAQNATIASSGSTGTATITHSSGSGIGLNITKGGNGEGLYVNKTSGTGNAATIIGTLNATTLVKSGGLSTEYLKADGSVSTLTNPITGTGVAGQVAYWSGTNTQVGSNNLFWDATNNRLGIGTNAPAYIAHIYNNGSVEAAIQSVGAGTTSTLRFISPSNYWQITNDGSAANLTFNRGGTNHARFSTAGNLILQNGGTFTDIGQRLQVTGDTLLKGSGNTSATTALTVQNSDGSNLFRVRNDGLSITNGTLFSFAGIYSGNILSSTNGFIACNPSDATTSITSGFDVSVRFTDNRTPTNAGYSYYFMTQQYVNLAYTSGTGGFVNVQRGFAPTSGTGVFNAMILQNTINQTGGANGITRGLYVNPTLTAAADWRSIEWSNNTGWGLYGAGTAANYLNGSLSIGTTTQSGKLYVTLQGINTTFDSGAAADARIEFRRAGTRIGFLNWDSGLVTLQADSGNFLGFNAGGSERARIFANGNFGIATGATDSGEKLQVNGTMKVTGASTFGGLVTVNSSATTLMQLTSTSSAAYLGMGDSSGSIVYLGSDDGSFLVQTPGSSFSNKLVINSAGAATFSSNVTSAGNFLLTNGNAGTIGAMNLIRTNTSPVASRLTFGTDGTGYSFVIGKNQAGTVTDFINLNDSGNFGIGISPLYKLDVVGEARVSSAIAIGTTPDTNKPFKILKNINATVGINFENTSTSSLAFSAIQMGTDVTGGTKFTNLVYASSGVAASGVYNPDGTSLINNGGGGLNFLGTPTRFYTGGGNGVLRLLHDNEGTTQFTATTPTTNATDGYKQYSADVVAGNAAPHFRTENGAVIKLYQETTSVGNSIISLGGGSAVLDDTTFDGYTLRQIVKALRNQGILQ